jgi:hypothetical protein
MKQSTIWEKDSGAGGGDAPGGDAEDGDAVVKRREVLD